MKKLALASMAAMLALGACERADDGDDVAATDAATTEDGTAAGADANATSSSGAMDSELSIAENMAASGDLSSFNDAVAAAGLAETLGGVGPYTVFAPNNAAFEAADIGDLLERGGPELVSLVSNHLVPGVVTAEDLRNAVERGDGSTELATMTGATLTVTADGDDLLIGSGEGQVRVTRADLAQANGMVHVVDGVLSPG